MAASEKLDLYKEHKQDFSASKKAPVLVDLPSTLYLAITGVGAPAGDVFNARIGGLYGVAFTIKMTRKFAGLGDYKICPLQGQWWTGGKGDFSNTPRDEWRWRILIRTPDFITPDDLKTAQQKLEEKGKPPEFKDVKLQMLDEGQVVQMLHVGPYESEPETIERMQEFVKENGLRFHGRHHEIYLSDPRRTKPEKLRTILRHPVKPR